MIHESTRLDFYDSQLNSPNPIRRWWHRGRREVIHNLVEQHHTGGILVDLGCGNCTWNYRGDFDVTGVDANKETLSYALRAHRLSFMMQSDVCHTSLISRSVSTVVTSEVMEHIENTQAFLGEIRRILQYGGHLIITVPYDTTFSLWKPLFALQCRLKASDNYYKNKCGHIHHFNKKLLRETLSENGLEPQSMFVYAGMTLCCVARRIN